MAKFTFSKAPITFVVTVHTHQRPSYWTYFREVCHCGLALMSV